MYTSKSPLAPNIGYKTAAKQHQYILYNVLICSCVTQKNFSKNMKDNLREILFLCFHFEIIIEMASIAVVNIFLLLMSKLWISLKEEFKPATQIVHSSFFYQLIDLS